MGLETLTGRANRFETFRILIEKFELKVGLQVGALAGLSSVALLESGLQYLTDVDIARDPNIDNLEVQFGDRYQFFLSDSIEASKSFGDNGLCFVYLDGDHSYPYILNEIEAWWPKIRKGGVLAGHDFIVYEHPQLGDYGVVDAVLQFCYKNNQNFYINGLTSTDICGIMEFARKIGQQQKDVELGRRTEHVEIPNFWIMKGS